MPSYLEVSRIGDRESPVDWICAGPCGSHTKLQMTLIETDQGALVICDDCKPKLIELLQATT